MSDSSATKPRTAMANITFTPSGETIEVPKGTSLLDAAILCELDVPAPCAGQGRCGRCRVLVTSGEVERRSNAGLATAEHAAQHLAPGEGGRRLLADSGGGDHRGRGLAERTAAHLVADRRDRAATQFQIEGDAVAAERVIDRGAGIGRCEAASPHRLLGPLHDRLLIEIVAHRSFAAAASRPVSSASTSASLL